MNIRTPLETKLINALHADWLNVTTRYALALEVIVQDSLSIDKLESNYNALSLEVEKMKEKDQVESEMLENREMKIQEQDLQIKVLSKQNTYLKGGIVLAILIAIIK